MARGKKAVVEDREKRLVRQHVQWMEALQAQGETPEEHYRRDFSEAPIAKWYAAHTRRLADQKAANSDKRKWLNNKKKKVKYVDADGNFLTKDPRTKNSRRASGE